MGKHRKSSSSLYSYDSKTHKYKYNSRASRKKNRKKNIRLFISLLISLSIIAIAIIICIKTPLLSVIKKRFFTEKVGKTGILSEVPEFDDIPYVELNGNKPYFSDEDLRTEVFEDYSELDSLGRCGVAYANICKDLMPQDEREDISGIFPTGWINNEYDIVDQKYLYNRCHLIGFQLAGENANEKNLITGTRYFNIEGMLPFEDEVAMYVYQTNNHVLYRVTPVYYGDNLVVSGVEIEAESVEDKGEGVCFNVFVYNVQPGIEIDYNTGDNWKSKDYEQYQ